jgi:hypothetical protein
VAEAAWDRLDDPRVIFQSNKEVPMPDDKSKVGDCAAGALAK